MVFYWPAFTVQKIQGPQFVTHNRYTIEFSQTYSELAVSIYLIVRSIRYENVADVVLLIFQISTMLAQKTKKV